MASILGSSAVASGAADVIFPSNCAVATRSFSPEPPPNGSRFDCTCERRALSSFGESAFDSPSPLRTAGRRSTRAAVHGEGTLRQTHSRSFVVVVAPPLRSSSLLSRRHPFSNAHSLFENIHLWRVLILAILRNKAAILPCIFGKHCSVRQTLFC